MKLRQLADPSLLMLVCVLVVNVVKIIQLRRVLEELQNIEPEEALLGVVMPPWYEAI